MRIEVLVSDENPVFYDLKKSRMVVGSDIDGCDVIISHPDVSRQHLIIISENDEYFVMDRGSTNGSYLNEERLIPGRKVEFNTFFPVRLGTDILISLVSDETEITEDPNKIEIPIPLPTPKPVAKPASSSDTTRVISAKDLKQAKTETLVKRREENAKADPAKKPGQRAKKKQGFKMSLVQWAALSIMLVALYLNNPFKRVEEPIVVVPKADEQGRVVKKNVAALPFETPKEIKNVNELQSRFEDLFEKVKCQAGVEAEFCSVLTHDLQPPWGAILADDTLFILAPLLAYQESAKSILGPEAKEEEILTLAAAVYLVDGINIQFNSKDFGKIKIAVGLFAESKPSSLSVVLETSPAELLRFRIIYVKRRLLATTLQSLKGTDFRSEFYRLSILKTDLASAPTVNN